MVVTVTGHTARVRVRADPGRLTLAGFPEARLQLNVAHGKVQMHVAGQPARRGVPNTMVHTIQAYEGQVAQFRARVRTRDGADATQSTVEVVRLSIYDLDGSTPETPVWASDYTVADVVFDSLQIDAGWTTDSHGYNLKIDPTDAIEALGEGGRRYLYEVAVQFSDDDEWVGKGVVQTLARAGE